ncbi:MAG: signal peptide peptidase SppA [Halioglobus sp.]
MKLWSLFRRLLSACWNVITRIRLALANILFLLIIAVVFFVYMGGAPEPLPERAALLLNPMGTIVDEKSFNEPLQALLGEPSPADNEVLLRDVIDAINFARVDPAINSLVMELDSLVSVGISKSQEIAKALEAFKDSGKPIIAVGDYYSQGQYLLASHADTIILHPFGGVGLEGFSSYQNYYREALEKLSVSMHVFKAGEHKSAIEPLVRDDMSPGEKAISQRWLDALWQQYVDVVENQRSLPAGTVNDYIATHAVKLQAQGGDLATSSLQAGLVDQLLGRTQAEDYLAELVGATNDEGLYEAVLFERYVSRQRPQSFIPMVGPRVAVITAEGVIQGGDQPPGAIGGDSLARLIRTTAEEDGVEAIVLRINSGGGSLLASEIIRQELLRVKAAEIPLVISMGAVAASGGYYIAAEADQIWATPGTITGSIGVFAAFPTFEKLLARGGVYTDGVGTTPLAGSLRLDRPLNETLIDTLTSHVEFSYQGFITLVAEGRGMTAEAVDAVAQGRVWSASDALEHGLIDKLGSLEDAIIAAAALAELDEFEIDYVGAPLSPREMLLQQLTGSLASLNLGAESTLASQLENLAKPFTRAVQELANMNDPAHLYVRCVACGSIN